MTGPSNEFDEPGAFNVSRAGQYLAIAALLTVLALLLFQPGWGSLLGTLGGFLLLAGTPLSFLLSLIGLIRGIDRKAALRGLLISGALVTLLFLVPFITRCFR